MQQGGGCFSSMILHFVDLDVPWSCVAMCTFYLSLRYRMSTLKKAVVCVGGGFVQMQTNLRCGKAIECPACLELLSWKGFDAEKLEKVLKARPKMALTRARTRTRRVTRARMCRRTRTRMCSRTRTWMRMDRRTSTMSSFQNSQSFLAFQICMASQTLLRLQQPLHQCFKSYGDSPFEAIQVYKLRRLVSCVQTTYNLSTNYLQVCEVLYVWITNL